MHELGLATFEIIRPRKPHPEPISTIRLAEKNNRVAVITIQNRYANNYGAKKGKKLVAL